MFECYSLLKLKKMAVDRSSEAVCCTELILVGIVHKNRCLFLFLRLVSARMLAGAVALAYMLLRFQLVYLQLLRTEWQLWRHLFIMLHWHWVCKHLIGHLMTVLFLKGEVVIRLESFTFFLSFKQTTKTKRWNYNSSCFVLERRNNDQIIKKLNASAFFIPSAAAASSRSGPYDPSNGPHCSWSTTN
jgi:hypothetical protein